MLVNFFKQSRFGSEAELLTLSGPQLYRGSRPALFQLTGAITTFPSRHMTTTVNSISASQDSTAPDSDLPPRIKFKRLDKTARHIMQACIILSNVRIKITLSWSPIDPFI